jgi:ATP-dependent Zn protease
MAQRKKDERSPEFLRKIATHEVGHAVFAWISPIYKEVSKVTIKAKGDNDGYTLCESQDETCGRLELIEQVAEDLAGMSAEELAGYVRNESASDDLIKATKKAHRMVRKLAMGRRVGLRVIGKKDRVSNQLQVRIDQDLDEILKAAYRRARLVIAKYLDEIEALVELLLERKTIGPKALEKILGPKA